MSATERTESPNENNGLRVGFLGCGTIAAAIARGLLTQTTLPISSVAVTKRSESKSSALKTSFPDRVTIFDDDDAPAKVIENSDVVFLCVLPAQVESVLSSITFEPERHTLISLVSTSVLSELAALSGLPSDKIYRTICLPSVAQCRGVSLLTPKSSSSSLAKTLVGTLGDTVECSTEADMKTMMSVTGLMGPMYGILKSNRDWLVKEGVPAGDASFFVARLYRSMIEDANVDCEDEKRFDDLIEEQTPGGLNEQSIKNLEALGVFRAYEKGADATLKRLKGETDGFVEKE